MEESLHCQALEGHFYLTFSPSLSLSLSFSLSLLTICQLFLGQPLEGGDKMPSDTLHLLAPAAAAAALCLQGFSQRGSEV